MAALLKPGDVVLAISYSGETQETYLAAKAARERGARIITITQAGGNRLSRLADYPLYMVGEQRENRVGAMTSRVSGLLVLDLLYLGMAKWDPAHTEQSLRETLKLIQTLQRR